MKTRKDFIEMLKRNITEMKPISDSISDRGLIREYFSKYEVGDKSEPSDIHNGMTRPIVLYDEFEDKHIAFDLDKNTSIVIAGLSGSGKSTALNSLIYQLATQAHPGEESFILFDFKGDPNYKAISKLPHVIHYENEINNYNKVLDKLILQLEIRKQILTMVNCCRWNDLREMYSNSTKQLRRLPYITVVVEETAAVLYTLESASKKGELKQEFIDKLKQIAKQGRSLGMRILLVCQRTTSYEIPRELESECGIKLCFKMKDSDLERIEMYRKEIMTEPMKRGIAVFKEEFLSEPTLAQFTNPGVLEGENMINLINAIALEWQRAVNYEELKIVGLSDLDTRNERIMKFDNIDEVFTDNRSKVVDLEELLMRLDQEYK